MMKASVLRRYHRKRGTRRGATAVEFAIVAPIFIIMLVASFEFSRLNVIRHTADNAAYEAARIGMVPGATAAEATNEANRILNIAGTSGARVNVNPAVITPATDQITVTIDVPLDQNGWITPRFARGRTIRSQSTLKAERVER